MNFDSAGRLKIKITAVGTLETNVTNSSGATALAGDLGYLDEAGEYQTTTTAQDVAVVGNGVFVVKGGADGAEITVTNGGTELNVNYTGSAPSKGDFLVTSTTAGKAQQQTTMHYAVCAVCTANGSAGSVEVTPLFGSAVIPLTSTNYVLDPNTTPTSGSNFVATQNGAPAGATVVYNAPSAGNEESIDYNYGTNLIYLILHNTTRGTSAKISGVNIATNTITVTSAADIAAWQNGDTLTARSQTNTGTIGGEYFFDYEFQDTSVVPYLARGVTFSGGMRDNSGTTGRLALAPYEAYVASKNLYLRTLTANVIWEAAFNLVPLVDRKFTMLQDPVTAGLNVQNLFLNIRGAVVACPIVPTLNVSGSGIGATQIHTHVDDDAGGSVLNPVTLTFQDTGEMGYTGKGTGNNPWSGDTQSNLLQDTIAHIAEGGHAENHYERTYHHSDNSEFNNTSASDNNDIGVGAGSGATWYWGTTANAYAISTSERYSSHLYVRAYNQLADLYRGFTRVGSTDAVTWSTYLQQVSCNWYNPWRFIFDLVDTINGTYVRIELDTNTTADNVLVKLGYNNGGGFTTAVAQYLGGNFTGPWHLAIKRYESAGTYYARGMYSFGQNITNNNDWMSIINMATSYLPNYVRFYFQSYSTHYVTFYIDSVRRDIFT